MYNSSHGIIKEINTPHEENKRETQHKVGDAMELKEQRYVCTLAEYGNLTRAADRLYISQPALSIYISNLEKHLGTPLFDREGKKFELTKLGNGMSSMPGKSWKNPTSSMKN